MAKPKKTKPPVSSAPLYAWFNENKANRAKLRSAGYSHGQITNWKARGIPRAEVGALAGVMGIPHDDYLIAAGEKVQKSAKPSADLTDEARDVALAWMRLTPVRQQAIREWVFLESVLAKEYPWLLPGRPSEQSYTDYERAVQSDFIRITKRMMMREDKE